jgi:hypothetical protein
LKGATRSKGRLASARGMTTRVNLSHPCEIEVQSCGRSSAFPRCDTALASVLRQKRVRLTRRLTVLLRQAGRSNAGQPAASGRRPRHAKRWMSAWDGLAPEGRIVWGVARGYAGPAGRCWTMSPAGRTDDAAHRLRESTRSRSTGSGWTRRWPRQSRRIEPMVSGATITRAALHPVHALDRQTPRRAARRAGAPAASPFSCTRRVAGATRGSRARELAVATAEKREQAKQVEQRRDQGTGIVSGSARKINRLATELSFDEGQGFQARVLVGSFPMAITIAAGRDVSARHAPSLCVGGTRRSDRCRF